jgi:CubicO group peptidase (beta-lactamase class C family)
VLDVKTNAPLLPTIPQHIGSISKQFTATCILLLHQDGRLSIDDALSKHVPEILYGGRVRLRQMLNMVSGFPTMTQQSMEMD